MADARGIPGGFSIPGLVGRSVVYEINSETVQIEDRQSGDVWRLEHDQDCCEGVRVIRSVCSMDCMTEGYPVVSATIRAWSDDVPSVEELGFVPSPKFVSGLTESFTLTRLLIQTENGSLDVVWLGESNGYYNEGISVYGPDNRQVDFSGAMAGAGAVADAGASLGGGGVQESLARFGALVVGRLYQEEESGFACGDPNVLDSLARLAGITRPSTMGIGYPLMPLVAQAVRGRSRGWR